MEKLVFAGIKHLSNVDPVIRKLIKKHGNCTLYDDNSLLHKPPFHVLAWAIINQQLSVASARAIENKLFDLLGGNIIDIPALIKHNDEALAGCGLSRQKIRYLRTLSNAITSKLIHLEQLDQHENDVIAEILRPITGIGPWTIDMFLMFSLGRLNVLPLGDLALRKAISRHYNLPEKASLQDYQKVAEKWQPYQTIASWYLWASVD